MLTLFSSSHFNLAKISTLLPVDLAKISTLLPVELAKISTLLPVWSHFDLAKKTLLLVEEALFILAQEAMR
jgi:hypothetical protein